MKKKFSTTWTEREDHVLRQEWTSLSCKLLGERLGRSPDAVSRRAADLGLPKKKAMVRKGRIRVKGYDRQLTIRESIDRMFGRKS